VNTVNYAYFKDNYDYGDNDDDDGDITTRHSRSCGQWTAPDRGKYKIHRDRISPGRLRVLFPLFPQDLQCLFTVVNITVKYNVSSPHCINHKLWLL
jgi:hypothetical protein